MERSHPPQSLNLATSVDDNVSATDNVCVVCGDKISEEQDMLTLSECNHNFHRNCLESQLFNTAECPTCKRHCSLAEIRKEKVKPGNNSRCRP